MLSKDKKTWANKISRALKRNAIGFLNLVPGQFLIVNRLYCYCYNFKYNASETNVLVVKLCLRRDYIRAR